MGKVKVQETEETVLPAESNPQKVERRKVELTEHTAKALGVSREAELVEVGEVESVVEIDGKQLIVGNEEVV